METLRRQLDDLVSRLPDADAVRSRIDDIYSVHPFNRFEYIISTLLGRTVLTLDRYHAMRDGYIARNPFLHLFEISAPRGFGETWAHGHLQELVPELSRPTKKQDPRYRGDYDFFLDAKIRIEVKASRAVDASSTEPLYAKALASDSPRPFWMNFQQVKPACCDVFVWLAVWRDKIRYWVLASRELETHRDFSAGQHRGNIGEGQLHVRQDNIRDFDAFEVLPTGIASALRTAYARELEARRR